ncbi:MAG: tRNA (guanosine(46)-N7)-methyltransferase TrmB [Planctomycetales bacterium]
MRSSKVPAPPDLKPWFLIHEDLSGPFDWEKFFGNTNPVELEIGTGRGLFLLNSALARPETNFLGMELDYKEGRYAATRYQKRGLPNVRILGGDAKRAIREFIPTGSLAAVHIYFPDPWWKRRHHSRRMMTPEVVREIIRMLLPNGLLHFWTDVESYFEITEKLLAGFPEFKMLPKPEERAAEHDLDYLTNFERKKRQAGLAIYRGLWQKA